jgi:hypothetical protein
MNQATENKEDVDDIKVTESADGSVTVDMPDNFVPEEEGDKPQQSSRQDDGDDDGDDDQGDDSALTEARRSKRRAKRELAKRAKEEKDQYLLSLKRENMELMERLAAVEKKQSSADIARMNKAIEDEQLRLEYARSKMQEATSNSDGETFAKAQEMWYETRQKLESMKNMVTKVAKSTVKNDAAVNPRLIQNARQWMGDNDWYDPSGKDVDSRIAKVVDESLLAEGWDPAAEDYWEELDRRLSKRLPHRYTDDTDDSGNHERKRRSVVTGSGRESVTSSGGAGRGTFILDPEQVRAMKDAGLWDDPGKRRNMIKRYAEQARQQRNRS